MQVKLYSIISIILLLALLLSPVASFAASPHPLPYTAYKTVSVMDEPAAVERTTNQQILSYWSEDFSGEVFPPPGWMVYNLDGGEPNWDRVTDDYVSAPASAAHHFNVPPQISQVGWLVTPPVILPNDGEVFFSFYERTQRPQRYYKQELYLSTGDCNPLEGDFSLLLEVQGNGTWRQIEFDLSAFAGQTVCLGFLYEGHQASRWLIDDVLISAVIYNLSLEADVTAKTGLPSETVEYDLTLTNLGPVEDTYQLSITGAEWGVTLSQDEITLAPGASSDFTASVVVPLNAMAGDWDTFTLKAISQTDDDINAEVELTTTGGAVYAFSFTADPAEKTGLPGEVVEYELILTNLGNASDAYILTKVEGAIIPDPPYYPWVFELSEIYVALEAGAQITIFGYHTIGDDALAGESETVEVGATSSENPSTAVVHLATTADVFYNLSLTTDDAEKIGLPGATVVYDLTLTNTGNAADIYNLSFTGALWEVTLSHELVTLAVGESADLTASVLVPADANYGDWDAFTVQAVSQGDDEVSAEVELTTTAGAVYGLNLTADETELTGLPGDTVVYDLTLTNTGNASDTFDLSFTGALWDVTLSQDIVYLAAGESADFTASVVVPLDAMAGDWDAFTVEAVSQADDEITGEVELATTAGSVYGLTLTADEVELSGLPGETVSYDLTLTNTGNAGDTYDLSFTGAEWGVTLSQDEINLAAGASAEFTASMVVPLDAMAGDWDAFAVLAVSQGDGAVTGQVGLTTTAGSVYGLTLTAVENALSGLPGETVSYDLTLTNTGNAADTFDLSSTGAMWEVTLSHEDVTLAAGASVEVAVQVTVPGDAGDGDVDSVLVTAASTGSPGLTAEALLTTTSVLSPVASFDPSTLFTVVGEEVAFTNTSTGTEPLTFLWDFGDDATSTDTNPVHTFEEEGEYTVSLTASNTYGTSTFELVISAGFVPVAAFTASHETAEVGEEVTFTNTSTGTEPLTFLWDFGDDATSTDTNPVHTFEEEGEYTVSLTASNTYGQSTFELVINVGYVPLAAFTASHETAEVGEEVTFTNTSTGTEPLTFLWDFGDDATSTDIHPVHIYNEEGEYTVSLTASNTYGTSTFELVISAGYAPTAAFTASHEVAVVGEVISFTNASTGTAPLQYAWDFGHGSGSSAVNPTKSYPQPGLYTVLLTVSNPYGEDQTSLEILVVPAAPVGADLELTLQVDPLPVRINQPVTITATVTNHGPASATGVTASGEIPEFVIFVGASSDCTEEDGYLTCNLGEIEPGESVEAWITLIFTQAGTYHAVLGAAGLELDPHLENNQASAAILVEMNALYLPLMVRP
jgi:uncharacterized repeat protein (TIGR01451 family)